MNRRFALKCWLQLNVVIVSAVMIHFINIFENLSFFPSFFLSFFVSILISSFLSHTLKLCQLFLLLTALFIIVLFCAFAYPLALCILNANVSVCVSVCRLFAYVRNSYFRLYAVVERVV